MSMMEYFEMGYKVVVGSMWGDVELLDQYDVECYMDSTKFEWADDEKKVVYFYDAQDYDE